MNPYLNRIMIQDPKQFFGRRSEVRRILARLGADRPQSISIVGERRIGKSSLLYYLTRGEVQAKHLRDRSSLVIVFLDFQQLRNISIEEFFALLMAEIRQACREVPDTGAPGYRSFQALLDGFRRQNKKLVLLFDEFQAITSNPAFNIEFYSYLRSMANNYSIAYVTTSSIELQRLCYSSNISDSPFFNIFSNFYLKTFEKDEALELISGPSEERGVSLRPYSDEIIKMAGLFPFYLQIACSIYYDCLKAEPDRVPEKEEIADRFLEESGPHFDYVWEHSASECRHVLAGLGRGEQPRPEEVHICQNLQRKGYVVQEKEGTFRLFSSLFADHVRALEAMRRYPSGSSNGSHSIEPGMRVHQYQLLRKAGEGGMGVVFEAEDTALDRKVALKFIRPDFVLDELPRKRFLQEARAAASLNHPVITAIYELFEYGKHLGLAMEWIEGSTLKHRILNEGRIGFSPLVRWMIEALEGLEEAHGQGIIHRDITSSNLMISIHDHVKITDFGLARSCGFQDDKTNTALTKKDSLMGTIDYMSPEQAQGIPADFRSDLFSLGVVFYEGLTGKLPFAGDSSLAKLQAIIREPAPSLSACGIERASALDPIIEKLLAKTPAQRHRNAAELREDLRKLLA